MSLPPRARRALLVVHVATSVGWFGAVLAYLALDVTAVAGDDVATVRSAYLAMDLVAGYVIVPLAVASVLVGTVTALGSRWGLVRHHWVVVKLVLTLLALAVLLAETRTITALARAAASAGDPRDLPGTLPHSVGGLVVLGVVLVLSVVKPRGTTGWRRAPAGRSGGGQPPSR